MLSLLINFALLKTFIKFGLITIKKNMKITDFVSECTAYDFKLKLEAILC